MAELTVADGSISIYGDVTIVDGEIHVADGRISISGGNVSIANAKITVSDDKMSIAPTTQPKQNPFRYEPNKLPPSPRNVARPPLRLITTASEVNAINELFKGIAAELSAFISKIREMKGGIQDQDERNLIHDHMYKIVELYTINNGQLLLLSREFRICQAFIKSLRAVARIESFLCYGEFSVAIRAFEQIMSRFIKEAEARCIGNAKHSRLSECSGMQKLFEAVQEMKDYGREKNLGWRSTALANIPSKEQCRRDWILPRPSTSSSDSFKCTRPMETMSRTSRFTSHSSLEG